MSTHTDGTRLLARGFEVTFKDGSTRRLILADEPLFLIEEEFDGLENFTATLRRKPLGTARRVFALALGPECADLALFDSRRMGEYVSAIDDALIEALPEEPVKLRILQNHEVDGDRYQAGQVVEVSPERAKHLIKARVAKPEESDQGNGQAAPGASPGAASSMSRSASGTSPRRRSGG